MYLINSQWTLLSSLKKQDRKIDIRSIHNQSSMISRQISSSNIIIINSHYLFILLPSLSLSPTAPVFTALSLPAKSTKLILDTFSPLTPLFESVNVCVRMTENTACERELSEFIFVAATVLDLLPSAIRLSMSCKIVRSLSSLVDFSRYR